MTVTELKGDLEMKIVLSLAAALLLITSIPLPAQDADSDVKGYANAAVAGGGFGDIAASHSFEMTSVTCELQGKLDTRSAKVGDRVTLKTTEKVQTRDGTLIPRGSRLVGHISELQAHNSDRAIAQMGIVIDHAEMKSGESVPIHSLIRALRPGASVASLNSMDSDDGMSATTGAGGAGRMGGGGGIGSRGGMGGGLGAGGTAASEAGSLGGGAVGGTVDRAGGTAAGTGVGSTGAGVGADPGLGTAASARQDSAVQLAGHGDEGVTGGAHAAAAARTVPHPTGIPGIMLAGSSTASGLLLNADRRDIQFESGTRFEMGVVADR